MIRPLLVVFLALFFVGCESKPDKPMLVSTNLWIGYSPLYYADKKGWLRENNIKLIRTVSLGESMQIYQNSLVDVLCGTQYEIQKICKNKENKGKIILLDRSNGGDKILANRTTDELKSQKKIDVYLELNSVNMILFESFMKKYGLNDSAINYIDKTSDVSSKLHLKKNPTVIVTYSPYDESLKKRGYMELASTKESELLVIDGVYASDKTTQKFAKEIDRLNFLIAKSLKDLKTNPKEYFDVINPYFGFSNYDEFSEALLSIEWIYDNHSVVIKKRAQAPSLKRPEVIKAYSQGM